MENLAILASESIHPFAALLKEHKQQIKLLFSDRTVSPVIEYARESHIPVRTLDPELFNDRADFEMELLKIFNEFKIDVIALAEYKRLITTFFLKRFSGPIINLHPSLLPAFPGAEAVQQAYDRKVKMIGVTVHKVDEGIDTGHILEQAAIKVDPRQPVEVWKEQIRELSAEIYPKVLGEILKGSM